MKLFRYIIILIGVLLIIYNATKLDFEHLMEGDSKTALIGILAASSAVLLMLILNTAHAIKNKNRK